MTLHSSIRSTVLPLLSMTMLALAGCGEADDAELLDTEAAESESPSDPTLADDGDALEARTDANAQVSGSCPTSLIGWAGVSGDGVATTTGGGNAAPVRPKSADELLKLAKDATPRIIEIAGSFNLPRLEIGSNKTIVGVGANATINGGISIKGSKKAAASNIILRNLHVNGRTTDVDGDAVSIKYAHHVWIDHCDFYDGPDGTLDLTHAVNWVTISWTKIRYTPAYKPASGESSKQHRFAALIGHSDNNASEDTGRLKVTLHHNYWAEGVLERMPRVRFGQVHVLNNYFASPGNNYCVRAGRGAQLLVEGNYFDGVKSPHEFNNADDQKTAHITVRANVYNKTSGTQATGGGGTPFSRAPYAAAVEPAESLPAKVKSCAGPR